MTSVNKVKKQARRKLGAAMRRLLLLKEVLLVLPKEFGAADLQKALTEAVRKAVVAEINGSKTSE